MAVENPGAYADFKEKLSNEEKTHAIALYSGALATYKAEVCPKSPEGLLDDETIRLQVELTALSGVDA